MSDLGNKAIMAQNIQRLMNRAGKSRTQVCDDLGIRYTTFADWVNAKTYPRIDKIEMLANYFGVSKADLVESRNVSQESERQQRLEQIANEINAQKRLLQIATDSVYTFFSSLRDLVGSDIQTPRDILFRADETEVAQREIEDRITKFMEAATSEEKTDFLLRLNAIGQRFQQQMSEVNSNSSPSAPLEEQDTAQPPTTPETASEDG